MTPTEKNTDKPDVKVSAQDLSAAATDVDGSHAQKRSREKTTLSGEEDLQSRPLLIGERWEIVERLGEGGMSVVYKARHLEINRTVAIKVLLPHLTANLKNLQRFKREAKAASTLDHPNVIKVHDFGMTPDGRTYIILDFLEGRSLSELIAQEGKLDPSRALFIFVQTCNALAHAHERGIIHRDLKPSNVMIVPDSKHGEVVKIVDFGIAKLLSDDDEQGLHLTKTGEVFGSPLYMSPEQCRGQILDARSDVYSMGCLMYETLTGQPPIKGTNILDTMHKQIHESPQPLVDEHAPDSLLKRLNAVVMKALSKNPQDRYQSMLELETDLTRALLNEERDWRRRAKILKKLKKPERPWLTLAREVVIYVSLVVLVGALVWCVSFFAMYSPANEIPQPKTSLWTDIPSWPPKQESIEFSHKHGQYTALRKRALQDLERYKEKRPEDLTPDEVADLRKDVTDFNLAAEFYEDNGKWDQAALAYWHAYMASRMVNGPDSISNASVLKKLADMSIAQEDYERALQHLEEAFIIIAKSDAARTEALKAQSELERLQSKLGYFPQAQTSCRQLLTSFRRLKRDRTSKWMRLDTDRIINVLESELADLARRSSNWAAAKDRYENVVQLWQAYVANSVPENKQYQATALYGLALTELNMGRLNEATRHMEESYRIARDIDMPQSFRSTVRHDFLCLLRKTNPFAWIIASFVR